MMPREAGMAAVNDQRDRFTFPATRTCPLGPIFSTKPVARRHSRPCPLHPDGFSLGDSKYLYWRRIRSGVAMTGCHKISHQLAFSHQSLPRQPHMPTNELPDFHPDHRCFDLSKGGFAAPCDSQKFRHLQIYQPISSRSVPVTLRPLARVGKRVSAYLTTGDGSAI